MINWYPKVGEECMYLDHPVEVLSIHGKPPEHAEVVIRNRFGQCTIVSVSELQKKPERK